MYQSTDQLHPMMPHEPAAVDDGHPVLASQSALTDQSSSPISIGHLVRSVVT